MDSSIKSAAAEALTVHAGNADPMATQLDPWTTRVDPPRPSFPGTAKGPGDGALSGTSTVRNITVLPHVEGAGSATQLKPRNETRYQHVKHLGAGAMGEVNLAQDNDIGRTVAVKQLVADTQNPVGVARFIDEIRTIGQLEHPNIVPIHDVGVDQKGQIFFVMKYVDGETLESVIRKLQAGDPAYLARYTTDYRMEIVLGLLHALQCAHAQGVIHRDIKPANIMIGRFGEVVLMDWGVAKVKPRTPPPSPAEGEARPEFVGTPAYMSPEQSDCLRNAVDPRSDIYSVTVLFHELLSLRHYLADCKTVQQIQLALACETFSFVRLGHIHHPTQLAPPPELLHFLAKGLSRDQSKRFQSADEMIDALQAMRDGRIRVSCPMTLAKRMNSEIGRVLGSYPISSTLAFYSLLLLVIGCFGVTMRVLLTHQL